MKRYQKLIKDAVDEVGYRPLSRIIGAPSTSIQDWATDIHKTPHYKSLVTLAGHFNVPLPTLLMEHDDPLTSIYDRLSTATPEEINRVRDLLGIV